MLERSRRSEELLTARLPLRRPVPGDIDAIFAIHSDPATCLHNPADALSKREETVEDGLPGPPAVPQAIPLISTPYRL